MQSADENTQHGVRIDLAACHRLCARFGFSEGIDNHLTAMVPGTVDRFYLAPFGLLWSEVRARDFLEIDFTGKRVGGDGLIEDTALNIHLPVHRDAPHACAVLHTHMPFATALSMLDNAALQMRVQTAMGFHDDIAYLDYGGLALDLAEGARMAAALGTRSVLVLRNHGVLIVGATVAQAFERLYFFERACQVQLYAQASGIALRRVSENVIERTCAQFAATTQVGGASRTELHFAALKRSLDKSDSDYAD